MTELTTDSFKEDPMAGITVWTAPECVQCNTTVRAFESAGYPKAALAIKDLSHPDNAAQLQRFKERGYMQAPIVQTPQETWSGFNPGKVKAAADYMRISTPSPDMAMHGPGLQ